MAREALTVVLVAGVCLAFMARNWYLDAPSQPADRRQPDSARANSSLGTAERAKLANLRTLPAYQQAKQSLDELDADRAALLKAAAAADEDAMLAAGTAYRRTLARVRTDLSKLKSYLDTAEYNACWRDLVGPRHVRDVAAHAALESGLGILPR